MANVIVKSEELAAIKANVEELETRFAAKATELESMKARLQQASSKTGLRPYQVFATAKDGSEERRMGWGQFSEFTKAVYTAGCNRSDPTKIDSRLLKAASGLSESVAPDGGFLIPPEFSSNIFMRVYENDLLKRTDSYTVAGNTMVFPAIDETSRVDGSRQGGVLGYWLDEAQQVTKSKPKYRTIRLTLNKLGALAYATDELLTDSSVALDQFLTRVFAAELSFQVGAAIYRGDGIGKPLGLLNSKCTLSVAKQTGQAAATVVSENIVAMWKRMWGPSRLNSAWFINQDVEDQLFLMTIGAGTSGLPSYMPPGGLSAQPYGTLLGRPVIPIEFASTVGTVGDICLADLSQYITIAKGTTSTDLSVHLRFDFDETAFRVIFRLAGQPWWNDVLTPYQGSATQAPFITLATRS